MCATHVNDQLDSVELNPNSIIKMQKLVRRQKGSTHKKIHRYIFESSIKTATIQIAFFFLYVWNKSIKAGRLFLPDISHLRIKCIWALISYTVCHLCYWSEVNECALFGHWIKLSPHCFSACTTIVWLYDINIFLRRFIAERKVFAY